MLIFHKKNPVYIQIQYWALKDAFIFLKPVFESGKKDVKFKFFKKKIASNTLPCYINEHRFCLFE